MNPNVVEIKASLQWVFFRDERSRRWIAVCEPLHVTVEADSHSELRENIAEGLNLLFKNLLKDKELDQFLKMRGWSRSNSLPVDQEEVRFDVPIELIARQTANDSAAHIH